jgi:RNA polymerase sigma-70 factor (ECF subfamily)
VLAPGLKVLVEPAEFVVVLRRAQAGDEAAFAALFRATQPVVLRYLRAVSTPDLADDVAAEAWISVVRGLNGFADETLTSFQAWVLTMARRRWIDELRRRGRRHEVSVGTEVAAERAADETVESVVEQHLSAEAAMELIRQLPRDQAEVVTLRAIAGLSVEQVAEIVGKKPGTVRVMSHRGLRKLADLVTNSRSGSIEKMR